MAWTPKCVGKGDRARWFAAHYGPEHPKGKLYRITPNRGKAGAQHAADLCRKLNARDEARRFGFLSDEMSSAAKGVTFRQYAERWYTVKILIRDKPTYHAWARTVLDKHLLPHFGDRPLGKITREEIRDFLAKKRREGNVERMAKALTAIFNLAVDEHDRSGVSGNPALRQGIKRSRGKVSPAAIYDEGQIAHLLQVAENSPKFERYAELLWTLFYVGGRFAEMTALEPGDFDFHRGVVAVQRQVQWLTKKDLARIAGEGAAIKQPWWEGLPKHGIRLVECDDGYLARIRNLIEARERRLTGVEPPRWLFSNPEDATRPWRRDVFRRRVWKPLLKAAGLRYIKPHGARHTYCTNLYRATGDVEYVARQAGHASSQVTRDYYLHLVAGGERHKIGAYAAAIAARRLADRGPTGAGPELSQGDSTPASQK
jgi:integrase